ncbi:MAG: DUF4118 domain-containing protein [Gemmatirosa sp.]|nr:DUF4118 domain-containing protein [Gemmatirosa sp.]
MTERRAVRQWLGWFGALVLLTAGMIAVRSRLAGAHVALVLLLAVLGASAAGGRALGLTIAGVAFVAFNYFFVPPYHTLVVAEPLDWLVLIAFLVTSVVAAELLARATSTAAAATARAEEVDRLAALGAETLSAPGAAEALHAIAAVIRTTTGVDESEVYLCRVDGTLERAARADAASDDRVATSPTPVDPETLVGWLAETGQSAVELSDGTVRLGGDGRAGAAPMESVRHAVRAPDGPLGRALLPPVADVAETPAVRAVLLPLVVREHTAGVLRIASARGVSLTPEQARLLVALAYYAALGVERVRLVESAERAESERRVESLRSALLTAVSHDLRTPLTTIKGLAHEIAHGADASPGEASRASVIEAEADRLDGLVGDLLDLSRIQAGAVLPNADVNTADDLIGAALQRAAGAMGDHPVDVELPPGTLLAGRFDFTQSLRVLVNLMENAAKYAPAGTPVHVRALRDGPRLVIEVADRGPGVPPTERERIFEPFYRPPGTAPDVRGTGLGLSIARGLAEAQGGAVHYAPRAGGGSVFSFDVPIADTVADTVTDTVDD